MPFRSIAADPQELLKLEQAFEDAWASINAVRLVSATNASSERERLEKIIIELWQTDREANVAARALRHFFRIAERPR